MAVADRPAVALAPILLVRVVAPVPMAVAAKQYKSVVIIPVAVELLFFVTQVITRLPRPQQAALPLQHPVASEPTRFLIRVR